MALNESLNPIVFSPQTILELIESETKLVLSGKSRLRERVDVRKMYCEITRRYGFSLAKIGDPIEKNHATVLHMLRQFPNHMYEIDFRAKHEFLLGKVREFKKEFDEQNMKTDEILLRQERDRVALRLKHIDELLERFKNQP